jgi:hypothetical protein
MLVQHGPPYCGEMSKAGNRQMASVAPPLETGWVSGRSLKLLNTTLIRRVLSQLLIR